jgi:hypothetical protein
MEYLSFIDLIVTPILLIIFYFIGNTIRHRNIEKNSSYKYYLPGLYAKIFGSITICLVYVYYYQGGDTTNYYHDSVVISRLFLKSPLQAISVTLFSVNDITYSYFDYGTDWLIYGYDPHALAIDRICWPLCLLSFMSFIGQTLLLSFVCYQAIWKLFQMLVEEFPNLQRQMAFAVLFIPSVVFWGSGLLKDSITFACVALYTASFYQIIKKRNKILIHLFFIFFASYLLIMIKPYIFFALLPGSVLWVGGLAVAKVKNKLLKSTLTPFFLLIAGVSGYLMLRTLGSSLGEYRIDNVLNKAVITQQDLKSDYYGGASFNIGDFDPSVRGILGKAPIAIVSALFRPYLWEAYNPGMLVSGIENIILMSLTLYLLWKLRFYNLFRLMFRHHFLFFSMSFSLFFAFSVGLTTSNFGSLVRYKIPAIPFFVASLFIISSAYQDLQREDREKLLLKEDLNLSD